MKDKTRVLHGRTRWHAEVREGDNTLETYQWLPTRQEFDRQRYRRKGEADFPHPYLSGHATATGDHPQGATGPDVRICTATVGVGHVKRDQPLGLAEQRIRTKVRDDMKCRKCGTRAALHVHHTKGMKSHALSNLVTLCRTCHEAVHRSSQLQTVQWRAGCHESGKPGSVGRMAQSSRSNPAIGGAVPTQYNTKDWRQAAVIASP